MEKDDFVIGDGILTPTRLKYSHRLFECELAFLPAH